jgi:hypothetical protein
MKLKLKFDELFKYTNLIFLKATIQDKHTFFLVDTGCSFSTINEDYVKNVLNLDIQEDETNDITSFNKVYKINSIITLTDVSFVKRRMVLDVDFKIADLSELLNDFYNSLGLKLSGILGGDFLDKNNIVINYKDKIIEYENND